MLMLSCKFLPQAYWIKTIWMTANDKRWNCTSKVRYPKFVQFQHTARLLYTCREVVAKIHQSFVCLQGSCCDEPAIHVYKQYRKRVHKEPVMDLLTHHGRWSIIGLHWRSQRNAQYHNPCSPHTFNLLKWHREIKQSVLNHLCG